MKTFNLGGGGGVRIKNGMAHNNLCLQSKSTHKVDFNDNIQKSFKDVCL